MKDFFKVLEFELMNYFKNKGYLFTTFGVGMLLALVLCLPRFIDMSSILGIEQQSSSEVEEVTTESQTLVLYDEAELFSDMEVLENTFNNVEWEIADNSKELKNMV